METEIIRCEQCNKADAEIQDLRDKLTKALAALTTMRRYASVTHQYWDEDQVYKVGKRILAMAGGLHGYDPSLDAIHALIAEIV